MPFIRQNNPVVLWLLEPEHQSIQKTDVLKELSLGAAQCFHPRGKSADFTRGRAQLENALAHTPHNFGLCVTKGLLSGMMIARFYGFFYAFNKGANTTDAHSANQRPTLRLTNPLLCRLMMCHFFYYPITFGLFNAFRKPKVLITPKRVKPFHRPSQNIFA